MTPNVIPTPNPTFSPRCEELGCGLSVAGEGGVGRIDFSEAVTDPNNDLVAEVLDLVLDTASVVDIEEAFVDVTPMVVRTLGVP